MLDYFVMAVIYNIGTAITDLESLHRISIHSTHVAIHAEELEPIKS